MAPAEVEYYLKGKKVETTQVDSVRIGRNRFKGSIGTINISHSKGEVHTVGSIESRKDGAKLTFSIPAEIDGQNTEINPPSVIIRKATEIVFRHPKEPTSYTKVKITKKPTSFPSIKSR